MVVTSVRLRQRREPGFSDRLVGFALAPFDEPEPDAARDRTRQLLADLSALATPRQREHLARRLGEGGRREQCDVAAVRIEVADTEHGGGTFQGRLARQGQCGQVRDGAAAAARGAHARQVGGRVELLEPFGDEVHHFHDAARAVVELFDTRDSEVARRLANHL